MQKPHAILVFGAPASGKTSFADQFSKHFKAPFINLSELKIEHGIDRDIALIMISEIAKCGQTLVIEGGIDTEAHRNEMRKALKSAGYQPILVWIQTDVTTLKSRLKSRLKSVAKARTEFDARVKELEAPADLEWPIVLSGKHTFATQLKTVLTHLSK